MRRTLLLKSPALSCAWEFWAWAEAARQGRRAVRVGCYCGPEATRGWLVVEEATSG